MATDPALTWFVGSHGAAMHALVHTLAQQAAGVVLRTLAGEAAAILHGTTVAKAKDTVAPTLFVSVMETLAPYVPAHSAEPDDKTVATTAAGGATAAGAIASGSQGAAAGKGAPVPVAQAAAVTLRLLTAYARVRTKHRVQLFDRNALHVLTDVVRLCVDGLASEVPSYVQNDLFASLTLMCVIGRYIHAAVSARACTPRPARRRSVRTGPSPRTPTEPYAPLTTHTTGGRIAAVGCSHGTASGLSR